MTLTLHNSVAEISYEADFSACVNLTRLHLIEEDDIEDGASLIAYLLGKVKSAFLCSVQLEFPRPPKDRWAHLRKALDKPIFHHLHDLYIVVDIPQHELKADGALKVRAEMGTLTDLRGFRFGYF
jgi:hypothetical protein